MKVFSNQGIQIQWVLQKMSYLYTKLSYFSHKLIHYQDLNLESTFCISRWDIIFQMMEESTPRQYS